MKSQRLLIFTILVLLFAQMSKADQVLLFDRFIVDRSSVKVSAEERNGKLMLKVSFGSGLSEKYIQLLYKETDGSPEAVKGLENLVEILRDENISIFRDAEFTTKIGLNLEQVLGAYE